MANWKTTVEIGDLHQAYRDEQISVQELGKAVAARFNVNTFVKTALDYDSPDFNEDLEAALIGMDEGLPCIEDYDYCLKTLYDFGDTDHKIWIDTITD